MYTKCTRPLYHVQKRRIVVHDRFSADQPYNQLPLLPPSREQVESVPILRQESRTMRALAELKGMTRLLPNLAILVALSGC